ncbi:MAG: universal stress protein [Deltaproteobacteria bacterium]|nr:universal stress protein [Deltaproteobacteria bacterium]
MFKKILFPIDFSLHSNTLLNCIPHLKKAGMEEIILLHVIDPTEAVQWVNVKEAITARKEEAEGKMRSIISETFPLHAGIKGSVMTAIGLPYREILRIADENKVSLIVMGSHGHGFWESAILGSVAHNVLRKTRVPVIIAKLRCIEENGETKTVCMEMQNIFRKILCPTDFSDSSMSALRLIRQLEKSGTEEVIVAHIQDTRKLLPHLKHMMKEFNQIDSERLAQIQTQLEPAGYKVTTILQESVPSVAINKIAEEKDISVIVLSSHGRSAIKEALMGSVSEAIVRDHIRPVMIIPRNFVIHDY